MSRYLELYLPTGSIEIAQTSRYSHKTGKSELCVIAVKPLKAGQVITDLKGEVSTRYQQVYPGLFFLFLFWFLFVFSGPHVTDDLPPLAQGLWPT